MVEGQRADAEALAPQGFTGAFAVATFFPADVAAVAVAGRPAFALRRESAAPCLPPRFCRDAVEGLAVAGVRDAAAVELACGTTSFNADWISSRGPAAQAVMPNFTAATGSTPTPHALMQETATSAKYTIATVAGRLIGNAAYQSGVSAMSRAAVASLVTSGPEALALGVAAAARAGVVVSVLMWRAADVSSTARVCP
ncbi:hypothetical protein BOH72_17130 [Mycobacterium sp. WY10]|nr:hypothetical protein BOH72_17130 [Mycobacterium sp. WY10]